MLAIAGQGRRVFTRPSRVRSLGPLRPLALLDWSPRRSSPERTEKPYQKLMVLDTGGRRLETKVGGQLPATVSEGFCEQVGWAADQAPEDAGIR